MTRFPPATDEYYHVFNRGVDKRTVFEDNDEYRYFVHLLYVLNTNQQSHNTLRNFTAHIERGSTSINRGERVVDLVAFCLMPNHFHLLLRQRVENGISKYMQKVGTGYTMYFNERHERSGALFQGRYKYVHITTVEIRGID